MRIIQQLKKIEVNFILESLYLAVTAVYILKSSLDGVLFHIPRPQNFDDILRILACAVIFIKLGYTKAYSGKEWLICILTSTIFGFSWLSTRYIFLIDTALLMIGAVGMSYRKILKAGFWTGLYVLLLAMLGGAAGCISDRVYLEGTHCRHSFGITYPTDFSAHTAYLAIIGWVLYGGTLAFPAIICALCLAFFVYYCCRAYCSTITLCLLAAAALYHYIAEKYAGRNKAVSLMTKWIDRLLIYAMPVCAGIMITTVFLFGTGNEALNSVDILLTHRLSLGWDAVNTYGLKPFGTAFDLIGSGGGTACSWVYKYNFVDSSYVLILVRYGFMTLLTILIQFIYLGRKAIKSRQRPIALAAALIAVHSMIEHHLPEIAYNLFLLLPFADLAYTKSPHKIPALSKRRAFAAGIICIAGMCIVILISPRILLYVQTMVDILLLYTAERNIWFVAAVTICMVLGYVFLRLLTQMISAFTRKTVLPKWKCAGIAVLLFFCAAFFQGEQLLQKARTKYQELIESDRPVIEALLAADDLVGRVYVNHLPEIYKREFKNLSNLLYAGEGLACKENTTLITEDTGEVYTLMRTGFAYGELPSGHAVYTNSESAEEILTATGIALTDYYSRQQTVDLEYLAERNPIELSETGTLLLDGYEHSLWHGGGVTIYEGTLRVTYKLHLIRTAFDEGTAASAVISSDWGAKVWNQKDINIKDFDENGDCTYTIDTDLVYSGPDMEFLLIASNGVELEIQEITYGKVEGIANGYH